MSYQQIFRQCVLRGVSLVAMGAVAGAAHAQEANTADTSSAAGVQDVVVTAQFRSSKLQDTPLAITAMTGAQLADRSFSGIADVGKAAPSVNLRLGSAGYGKSTQAYIRGIGQTDFNFALEPAVGFYVDDVYQGTLFGKNSIGGAVRLISKKPSDHYEASIEGTYGSYERLDLRGMVNIPLVADQLALRLSVASKNRDGYVDRVDYACANPTLAGNLVPTVSGHGNSCKVGTLGGESVRAGRAALRWTPTSALEINLAAEIIRDNSEAAADSLIYVNTAATALVNYNNNRLIPTYGIPFDSRFITDPYVSYASYDSKLLGRSVPPVNTVRSESYSGDITLDLTENVQFKSVTAFQSFNGRFTQNANNSPLPVALTDNVAGFEQFTQEFRLVGTAFNDMLDWATGVFYFDGASSLGGGGYLAAAGVAFDQNDSTDASNRSAFVHGVLHLTERFSVTGGLRYTKESKTYRFDRVNVPSGTPFFAGGAFTSPASKFNRFDYKLGLDYKVTDDIMVYGQFSTGFKGGGINPRPFTPVAAVPFGPETLESYEFGVKSDLFDRLIRLNLAAYHSKYSNLQLSANGFDNNGTPSIVIANAGRATINGIEAEIEIRPAAGLQIDMSGSYTDFQIKDLGAAGGVSGGPTLSSKAPGVPEWKYNVGAQYEFDLGTAGTITPRVDAYYQSKVFNEWTNNARTLQGGYAMVNTRLTYNAPDDEWYAALSVTNLFEQFYYVNKFMQAGSYIFTGQPGRPREWALTVGRRF